MFHLTPEHESPTDRPDERPAAPMAAREDDENPSTFFCRPNGEQPVFFLRMAQIRENAGLIQEDRLDVLPGNAMLAAFRPVAVVPVKAV